MVSIIICSRSKQLLADASLAVKNSIGVPYEIVGIDNSMGKHGICEAYNIGARQARYGIVCFMHEDLRFHTSNWGQIVVDILSDVTIGVLGVAGGTYQMKVPAGWWMAGPEYRRMQVLHSLPGSAPALSVANPGQQALADVAVLDGLWLCSRKEVWHQHPFDEQGFPAFHFYDVDYCTEIFLANYRVCVTFNVMIEHFSNGTINDVWLVNALNYQKKWTAHLPFGTALIPSGEVARLERIALLDFANRLLGTRLPSAYVVAQLRRLLTYGVFDREILGMVKRFLKQRYFSKQEQPSSRSKKNK